MLVFGLDGATFKLLDPWLEGGKLPFLCRMRDEGVYGDLEAVLPTLSPLEWAGFLTGKNPAKLGFFGVGQIEDPREGSEPRLINSRLIEGPKLWDLLDKKNKSVGIMNIPGTYPPEPVNGFLVSGMMTPPSDKRYYHPQEIGRYLDNYKIGLELEKLGELPDESIEKDELLRELYGVHERRANAILSILADFPVDLFVVNFKEIDELQHLFWNSESTLLEFYRRVDESMKKICSEFDPTHIIVMSDHGFHEAEKEYFYTNRWLEIEGYLERTKVGKAYSLLHPLLSHILKGKIRELIPEELKSRGKVSSISGRMIEFRKTSAYANMWGVFISDEIKESEKYEDFKKELRKKIEGAEDPRNGRKIFSEVHEKEEIYSGKYLPKFPEFIIVPKTRYLPNPVLSSAILEPRLDKPYLEGAHKSDKFGILFASGEDIKKGEKINKANILDLAPTILHLFNAEIPSEMDGKVLTEVFEEETQ